MSTPLLTAVWAEPGWRPQLSVREWEALFGQARQSSLLARLAYLHVDKGLLPEVPDGPRPHLEGALRLADRQQHEVRWEVDCIRRALRGVDTPIVLLKGAAYLMADLSTARGRLFSDIDILVPHDRIADTESALFGAGWISDERDAYNERYYREWMHEIPPLRHIHRQSYIDLHHTITPPTSRFKVDGQELLRNIQPLAGYPGLYVLAPVDMVLHSAVHLFQEGEFGHGLRDLLDLHDLFADFQGRPGFWDALLNRADGLGLQIPLFHATFHLRRLFQFSPPPQFLERLEKMGPNPVSRTLMAWMLGLALRPDHPSCDSRWTGLARWLLYVRSHALRMPMRLLVPHLLRKSWMQRFPQKP
ncbi:nucleotidyltransferase family protein [Rhodoferax sp. WC2427]|uniref:nucleotidyltransferase domain-containing protein n=1 Tax=Rhodoferax sp. WC2427 TaxID=3234144 RepID=UPI003466E729